jgi:ketosteroid isomerase-like protein
MKHLFRALLVTLVVSPAAHAQAARSDTDAIKEAAHQFSAAYMRGDVDAITRLYTPDAVIFPERSDAISGHAALKRYWKQEPGQKVTRHLLIPTQVTIDGQHAYDHGIYEIAGERNGKAWGPVRGKYLVVWRRQPDGWKMQLDMWNSGPAPKP